MPTRRQRYFISATRTRKRGAWMGLAAMSVQILLALAQALPAAAADTGPDARVVCVVYEAGTATPDQTNPDINAPGSTEHSDCPVCVLSALGGTALPTAPAIPVGSAFDTTPLSGAPDLALKALVIADAHPRAPPFSL